ncbi:amidohydrolase [Mycobacterium paraintracellulare]|uniref:amidohydrolase family protein n=1 Tax=Mycobacterium paraintracellulare TaxID=1138383 RepID=UPI001926FF95|nr:amidohydrolase family protein [Mycobacterium paraintracellulare]BCO39217.1 amidohydrolase [Mycobacterium paraintracellulare]
MTQTSTIGMVSADSHVNEPRDLWLDNLPTSKREQAMQGIAGDSEGGWSLILDGRHVGKAKSSENERLAALDPEFRLNIMREEGIAGECIFPTIGLYVWMLQDPEGGRLSCRIYNEWIYDQLERQSPRFRCAGLVPSWSPEDAVAEVAYIADKGLGAVMIPAVATPNWNDKTWEPLWSAIEETGLPVVIHSGTGHDMIWYRGMGASVANLLSTQSMGPRVATLLATSGILERHSTLHFIFVEYTGGWLAWTMNTVDYATDTFNRYGTTANLGSAKLAGGKKPRSIVYPVLQEPPSFYIRRQIHATFQDEPVGLSNVALTGADCLMWGSDYPHEEGTYPHSRETVDRLGKLVDDDTALRIFRDNAANVFGFDRSIFATPA